MPPPPISDAVFFGLPLPCAPSIRPEFALLSHLLPLPSFSFLFAFLVWQFISTGDINYIFLSFSRWREGELKLGSTVGSPWTPGLRDSGTPSTPFQMLLAFYNGFSWIETYCLLALCLLPKCNINMRQGSVFGALLIYSLPRCSFLHPYLPYRFAPSLFAPSLSSIPICPIALLFWQLLLI